MAKGKTMALAIVCGVLCAAAVLLYLNDVSQGYERQRADALERYGGDQVEVCVATRDIAPGETLSDSNSMQRLWVADLLPDGSVSSASDIEGKAATSLIAAGEVVTQRRFAGTSDSLAVPEGMDAITVAVRQSQAVGGGLEAGARVNVYTAGDSSTKLLAQDVLVLQASSTAKSSGDAWVTVAIEPSKVEGFIAAMKKTDLYFALPGTSEKE